MVFNFMNRIQHTASVVKSRPKFATAEGVNFIYHQSVIQSIPKLVSMSEKAKMEPSI